MERAPLIIALCGFEGSGKDTVARLLTNKGWKSRAFAHNLKVAVAAIFGWPFHLLEGITEESRVWREQPDDYWSQVLGRTITPRRMLQEVGTDLFRNHFHVETWPASLKKTLLQDKINNNNVIVTDCRFPSEVEFIKSMGGKVIRVTRDATRPSWLPQFLEFAATINKSDYPTTADYCTTCATAFYSKSNIHPAETSLILYDNFD